MLYRTISGSLQVIILQPRLYVSRQSLKSEQQPSTGSACFAIESRKLNPACAYYTPSQWRSIIKDTELSLLESQYLGRAIWWARGFDPHWSTSLRGAAGQTEDVIHANFGQDFPYTSRCDVCSCIMGDYSWWLLCVEGISLIPRRLPLLLNPTLKCPSLIFWKERIYQINTECVSWCELRYV